MIIVATCSNCGYSEEYKLSKEEYRIYQEYQLYGRQLGMLQDLFPNIPSWIRSCSIDKYSGGFCICPNCQ